MVRHTRCKTQRRGAAVVEMAVAVPLIFLLVFGLIEFGRVVMVKQALTDAARAGCRDAVLATTIVPGDAESMVRGHLQTTIASSLDPATCRVNVTPMILEGMESGTEITVTADVDYEDVSWIRLGFLNGFVLTGEATMTRE